MAQNDFNLIKAFCESELTSYSSDIYKEEFKSCTKLSIEFTDGSEEDPCWEKFFVLFSITTNQVFCSLRFCHLPDDLNIQATTFTYKTMNELNKGLYCGVFKVDSSDYLCYDQNYYYQNYVKNEWKSAISDLIHDGIIVIRCERKAFKDIFHIKYDHTPEAKIEYYKYLSTVGDNKFIEIKNEYFSLIKSEEIRAYLNTGSILECKVKKSNIFLHKNVADYTPEDYSLVKQKEFVNYSDPSSLKSKSESLYTFLFEKGYNFTLEHYSEFQQAYDINALKAFLNGLKMMKNHNILFKKIPKKSIVIQYIESNDEFNDPAILKFLLGFDYLEKYTIFQEGFNGLEYDMSFEKIKIIFFLKLYKIKTSSESKILKFGKLKLSDFSNKSFENESSLLGKGGFGKVYKNKLCGITVAIKLELARRAENGSNKKMIEEFKLLYNLNHKNIIKTYGWVNYENRFGIVLEYCSKKTLAHFIKQKPHKMEFKDLAYDLWTYKGKIEFLMALGGALNYMHARNYAHFDIKPHNVFLTDHLEPKIADFGLTKIINSDNDKKANGCSLYYSPPEQIVNEKPDQSADVWGFGMIMFYLILEKHPFESLRSEFEVKDEKEKQKYHKFVGIDLKRPIFPIEFEKNFPLETSLMRMCWSSNKEKRPKMNFVLKELRIILKNNVKDWIPQKYSDS